jgi:hypothetical protein
MNSKEKKLLGMALLIFGGIVLPFKLVPLAVEKYQQQREAVARLKENIERYHRLEEQAELWRERHAEMLEQEQEIRAGLLRGSTRELVAARLQGILKELAQQSGVQVQSLDLPEFSATANGNWLLVTQNVRINANSEALWQFLRKLAENPTRLAVISLDVRSYQNNQLNGTLKVTGFNSESDSAPLVDG